VAPWEKLQGAFQLMLLIAAGLRGTAPAASERSFCIGQFLCFHRPMYNEISGHHAVRDRVAEDLAFARLVREHGGRFELLIAPGALRVRMYPEGLGAFLAGWRRNFREGLRSAGRWGFAETALVLTWLLGAPLWVLVGAVRGDRALLAVAVMGYAAAVVGVAFAQRRVGRFPTWTALVYPLSLTLFTLVATLATWDRVRRAPISWRGRQLALTNPTKGVS
jgi:hypothetical protein